MRQQVKRTILLHLASRGGLLAHLNLKCEGQKVKRNHTSLRPLFNLEIKQGKFHQNQTYISSFLSDTGRLRETLSKCSAIIFAGDLMPIFTT